MNTESNPASRLHVLLKQVISGDPKKRMLDVWAELLSIDDRHDVEVARRLVMLNEMLDDAERTIKSNSKLNHAVYLSCFPQIRTVFSPIHLQSSREGLAIPHLTDEVLARLEFCAEALREEESEIDLTPDELKAISEDLNNLIEQVASSEISPALRRNLLEVLETARVAISLYRVYGAKGLRKNLQSLFGFVYTERVALKKEAETNTDVLEKLGKWIDRIDSVSAKALKVQKALTKPVQFLLGLVTDSADKTSEDTVSDGQSIDA
jgi:hypothetical protein